MSSEGNMGECAEDTCFRAERWSEHMGVRQLGTKQE